MTMIMMRSALAMMCVMMAARAAAAEVEPPSKWVRYENKNSASRSGIRRARRSRWSRSACASPAPKIATLEVTVTETKDTNSSKSGGKADNKIDWKIAVPKRASKCHAETDDDDKAVVASSMCDSIELTPGPREPHVELAVTSSGLVDGAAFEKLIRGLSSTRSTRAGRPRSPRTRP